MKGVKEPSAGSFIDVFVTQDTLEMGYFALMLPKICPMVIRYIFPFPCFKSRYVPKKIVPVLVPGKGDLTQKVTIEMIKSKAFEPAPAPEINVGMVTDFAQVTEVLKSNASCIASSSCTVDNMSCGPQD